MQHTDLRSRLVWLQRQCGRFVTLTCGDTSVHLLLLDVYHADCAWWLAGYDNGDIGEPLVVCLSEVTAMRGERPFRCPVLRRGRQRRQG